MTQHEQPFVSIIIPAFNEEQRLPPTLIRVANFLRSQPYAAEVIVVENGSTDDTSGVVERFEREEVTAADPFTVRLLHSKPGKGAAVKLGMLAGRGEFLVISDTDLAVPIEELNNFLPPVVPRRNYAITIASREIPGAVRHGEPAYRHVMGRVFNFLVRVLAVHNIQDTQCGFKCFSQRAAHQVFPLQTIDGWGFDVEVLYIAQRHNLPIVEIPVNWYYGADSRVSPLRDTINMLKELLLIRRNGRKGLYDELPASSPVDESVTDEFFMA